MLEAIYYIFVFVIGISIGSFLNVCIYRLPREESVVKPASHCTRCGKNLGALELIPILSYFMLRGKCSKCKAEISLKYPAVELLTGAIYIILLYKFGLTVDFAASAYLMSILIAVFFIDAEHKIIPDELVIAGLIGGVPLVIYNLFNPVLIYGDRNWWTPLLGMISGSGILLIIALVGGFIYKTDDAMGGGDLKIYAPIGIFLGWKMTLLSLLLSIFASGIVGIVLIVTGIKDRKGTIPLGPYIVAGTFVVLLWGWDILNYYLSFIRI